MGVYFSLLKIFIDSFRYLHFKKSSWLALGGGGGGGCDIFRRCPLATSVGLYVFMTHPEFL